MTKLLAALLLAAAISACGVQGPQTVLPPHSAGASAPAKEEAPDQKTPGPSGEAASGPGGWQLEGLEKPDLSDDAPVEWVTNFIKHFYREEFESPHQIPAQKLYWYAFNQIGEDAWQNDADGVMKILEENGQVYPISKDEADRFILRHFGLTGVPYEGTVEFDAANQEFLYYYAHGGVNASAEILEAGWIDEDTAFYRTEITLYGTEERKTRVVCRFQVAEEESGWYFQALSMKQEE